MKFQTLFCLALFTPFTAAAAVFDAADILPQNAGAVGVFGELLLSDPTSEGVEARARYGLSEEWNVAAILGVGSKAKRFRFGGEAVYNILPDWEGQVGFSALASAILVNRPNGTGLQLRVGPMVHKQVTSWGGLPAILYLAVPLYLEGKSGTYSTGSQIVFGTLMNISEDARYYFDAEAGVKIARSESYVLVGAGMRFGELRFQKRERDAEGKPAGAPELRDEDFR